MRVYIVTILTDIHEDGNPYIYTLMDSMSSRYDVQFGCGLDIFWSDSVFGFDVVHIMWPTDILDGLSDKSGAIDKIRHRLSLLREKGIKIVGTCHNLIPHYGQHGQLGVECYEAVYGGCDMLIHLGQYSYKILRERLPGAGHIVIPHHVYDTVYHPVSDKVESLRRLNLSERYQYILCFGAVRSKEEIGLILRVGRKFKHRGIRLLVPRIMHFPYGRRNPVYWIWAAVKYLFFRFNGVVTFGKGFISDEYLTDYYAVSSLCLIHRTRILNSGNVQMAFLMGKVAVGPDAGNVGCLLNDFRNPVFDPWNLDSVIRAIEQGLSDAEKGLGERNRQRALSEWSTDTVARRHYEVYKGMLVTEARLCEGDS